MADYLDLGISTFQSRLAQKQDSFKRKVIDNVNLRNVSSPIDCILCKMQKDYRGDDMLASIKSIDIIRAVFPAQVNIPFRRISLNDETKKWEMTSPIEAFEEGKQEACYTVQGPWNYPIDKDDYIFRIYVDEDITDPIIVTLQVKELVGDFGGLKMIMQKALCTIPTVALPPEMITTIYEMGKRRTAIGY